MAAGAIDRSGPATDPDRLPRTELIHSPLPPDEAARRIGALAGGRGFWSAGSSRDIRGGASGRSFDLYVNAIGLFRPVAKGAVAPDRDGSGSQVELHLDVHMHWLIRLQWVLAPLLGIGAVVYMISGGLTNWLWLLPFALIVVMWWARLWAGMRFPRHQSVRIAEEVRHAVEADGQPQEPPPGD